MVRNNEVNDIQFGLTRKDAERKGIEVEEVIIPGLDKAHYYPGNRSITIRLLADKSTATIIGGEISGEGEIQKRINVAKVAMIAGTKLTDLQNIDLTYAPPYSSAMDVFIHAVNMLLNKLKGSAEGIMPEQLYQKISDDKDKFILIDVRSPEEFSSQHIKNAINIPLNTLEKSVKEFDRDKEYILNCMIGKRSYLAYKKMKRMGFSNVKHLDGGISAWKYPLES